MTSLPSPPPPRPPTVVIVGAALDGPAVDEFVETVRSSRPKTGIVVLTEKADVALVARSLESGL